MIIVDIADILTIVVIIFFISGIILFCIFGKILLWMDKKRTQLQEKRYEGEENGR